MSIACIRIKVTQVLVIIIIATLIVGCSASGTLKSDQVNPPTSAEARLQQESQKFVKKVATGSIFGAVVGGAAGATLGAVLSAASGRGEIIWQLAVAGAAAGAVIGGVSAIYFDEKQKQYAKEEDRINSMISDVKKDNLELLAYEKTVQEYISSSEVNIAYVKQQYKNKSAELKTVQEDLEKFHESQKLIAQTVKFMREKKKAYAEAVAMQNKISGARSTVSLDDQISDLEVNITHLEWQEKSLVSSLAISPAG